MKAAEENIGRGSLVLDCETRWNSTFFMLSSALKFRSAFDRMAEEDKLYDAYFHEDDTPIGKIHEENTLTAKKRAGPPSSKDWDNARVMVTFLSKFYDSTLIFSASTKVTSNKCLNEICKLEKLLKTNAEGHDSDPILKATACAMKYEKFDKYWEGFEKINKLLIVAPILDPRCKMGFVELCFEKLYGQGNTKCVEVKGEIENLLCRLYDVYSASYKSSLGSAESTKASGNKGDFITVLDASVDGFDEGFDLSDVGVEEKEEEDPFGEWGQMAFDKGSVGKSSELELYMMEKIENPKPNKLCAPYDVLSWWK